MAVVEVAKNRGGTTIGHHECTADDNSIVFGSTSGDSRILNTYQHLMMVVSTRGDKSTYFDYYKLSFNDDSVGSNYYSYTTMTDNDGGSDAVNARSEGQGYIRFDGIVGASSQADVFGTAKIWIPNYNDTANQKQVFIQWSKPNKSVATGSNQFGLGLVAGHRNQNGAITQVSLGSGDNFVQYSTFTLYGINT